MQRMPIGMVNVLIFGLLTTATVAPTTGWSQMSVSLQQVEQQWREKQRSTEMHRQQMERITDPAQLAVETRRHFQMTEELLALLFERQTLLAGQASRSSGSASMPLASPARQTLDEPKRGAPGGYLWHSGKDPRTADRPR